MITSVLTYNLIEGYHNYPEAPSEYEYLSHRHRHMFEVRCSFIVEHDNREIEINKQQRLIEDYLHKRYGCPCEFGGMSCEMICKEIATEFGAKVVEVKEDGYGGATLSR